MLVNFLEAENLYAMNSFVEKHKRGHVEVQTTNTKMKSPSQFLITQKEFKM